MFTACICVYNDWRMIAACIRQFPEWVEKILVLHTERPWFGDYSDEAIRVSDEVNALNDPRVEYVRLPWRTEHEQRNWGLGRLYDSRCVFTLDADEFITPDDWASIKEQAGSDMAFSFVPASMTTYWKTWDYVWVPPDWHKPVMGMNPRRDVFFDKRAEAAQLFRVLPVTIHHLSWVRTDKEVLQKIENYMHANDFDREAWFTDVWSKWTPGDTELNLRPYGSEGKTTAKEQPIPDAIKIYFKGDPLNMV